MVPKVLLLHFGRWSDFRFFSCHFWSQTTWGFPPKLDPCKSSWIFIYSFRLAFFFLFPPKILEFGWHFWFNLLYKKYFDSLNTHSPNPKSTTSCPSQNINFFWARSKKQQHQSVLGSRLFESQPTQWSYLQVAQEYFAPFSSTCKLPIDYVGKIEQISEDWKKFLESQHCDAARIPYNNSLGQHPTDEAERHAMYHLMALQEFADTNVSDSDKSNGTTLLSSLHLQEVAFPNSTQRIFPFLVYITNAPLFPTVFFKTFFKSPVFFFWGESHTHKPRGF